ncbi:hypothetical protein JCM16161A_02900 [Vulcanisaeta sp. JCM 16161]|uniref:hypothetical protein n=1 Tax=Vulcanisaeta sp. JCM 16161 TaxID=1295372 RepID=UPI001FB42CBD|nr:hypothetical protein [Vulcanisaeta sp. JCM 16161]
MGRIGRLYRIDGSVEVRGRIGRLYPAYKHPWVIELGSEDSSKAKNKGGEGGGYDSPG